MSPQWFERIIVPQRSIVLDHALSILRTPSLFDDAEDVRSAAEIATWRKFTAYPDPPLTDPDNVIAYYWGCVKYAAINFNRLNALHDRLRTAHHDEIVNNLLPNNTLSSEEIREIIEIFEIAREHLSQREFQVIYWRHVERFPLKDIAARLGITSDNARQIHHRALNKLTILLNGIRPPDGPGGGSGAKARSRASKKSSPVGRKKTHKRDKQTPTGMLIINYKYITILLKLFSIYCALRNIHMFTQHNIRYLKTDNNHNTTGDFSIVHSHMCTGFYTPEETVH